MQNNKTLKIITLVQITLFLFICTQTTLCYDVSFDQFIKSTPSTFGLITVTHARNGAYSYIQKHIDYYAEMNCPEITQISVVWNNDVTPESAGFTQSQKWKRPVYFIKTPYNSMDFRYMLPKESTAKVFFSIDDDIVIKCQQMRKSFELWKSKAIGDLAPLITYGPRGFNFNTTTQQYIYDDPLKARFYSISLIGVCWVPRFYFELYNSQKSLQINQMREIVKERNNCDDIALNYLISYFFPEFIPIALEQQGALTMKIQPSSQGLTKTHYPYRNQCLKKFTDILGYNPLRIVNRADKGNQNRLTSIVNKYAIYMRKKQLTQKLLQENGENKQISFEQMIELEQQIKQEISQKKQKSYQELEAKKENAVPDDESILLKQELKRTKEQYNMLLRVIAEIQQNLRSTEKSEEEVEEEEDKIELQKMKIQAEQKERFERTKNSIDLIFKVTVFLTLLVIVLCICLVKNCCARSEMPKKTYKTKSSKKQQQIEKLEKTFSAEGIVREN